MTGGTTGAVVIAGASGFMGRYLVDAFQADGDVVVTVGRGAGADIRWGDRDALVAALDGARLLVNLAGRSVNARYGRRTRETILRSRVETTRELGAALASSEHPPALWINSSTATIYRHATDRPQTESTGERAPSTPTAPAAAGSGSPGCTSRTCSGRSGSSSRIPNSTARSTSPHRIPSTTAP